MFVLDYTSAGPGGAGTWQKLLLRWNLDHPLSPLLRVPSDLPTYGHNGRTHSRHSRQRQPDAHTENKRGVARSAHEAKARLHEIGKPITTFGDRVRVSLTISSLGSY